MKETQFQFSEKLEKNPFIKKYYNSYISKCDKTHPLTCHLVCNTSLLEFNLEEIEKLLEKLDDISFLPKIVKESKNPFQFFDMLSEMKVAVKLIDSVDYIDKISKKEKAPDFKITIDGVSSTLEVKRIKDKLSFNHAESDYAQILHDDKTICNRIIDSFPQQTIQGKPHIIIFDCSFSTADNIDFEDVLYLKKGEIELSSDGKKIIDNENTKKIFHQKEKNGEYRYAALTGVIGLIKESWIFYRNPYVKKELEISEGIINRLGLEKFQILDENLQK